ncbi:hypothetical protein Cagg_3291 [Chloroflexus aggregans DSM 9485]|uniref:Uncharacterized protein n=1 Tax=Chloroflexus aggregans (strain MD-66 / DSM 9485) TaxID=326427 RepID=B8G889_CHLAD|nr:hypothetical protein Cagg_3291 [Chloroflexus aggregans DSM 9485]
MRRAVNIIVILSGSFALVALLVLTVRAQSPTLPSPQILMGKNVPCLFQAKQKRNGPFLRALVTRCITRLDGRCVYTRHKAVFGMA